MVEPTFKLSKLYMEHVLSIYQEAARLIWPPQTPRPCHSPAVHCHFSPWRILMQIGIATGINSVDAKSEASVFSSHLIVKSLVLSCALVGNSFHSACVEEHNDCVIQTLAITGSQQWQIQAHMRAHTHTLQNVLGLPLIPLGLITFTPQHLITLACSQCSSPPHSVCAYCTFLSSPFPWPAFFCGEDKHTEGRITMEMLTPYTQPRQRPSRGISLIGSVVVHHTQTKAHIGIYM